MKLEKRIEEAIADDKWAIEYFEKKENRELCKTLYLSFKKHIKNFPELQNKTAAEIEEINFNSLIDFIKANSQKFYLGYPVDSVLDGNGDFIEEVEIMDIEKKNLGQKIFQDNKMIQKRNLCSRPNILIQNDMLLDEYQFKIINLMLSKIKQEDTEFKFQTIGFSEFLRFMGIKKGGNSYKVLFESIKKLMSLNFAIEFAPGNFTFFHYFASGSSISYTERNIYLKFDEALAPLLLGLKKDFTCYELGFVSKLHGKYTCRLYELFHSYANADFPFMMTVEQMHSDIVGNKYKNVVDIEKVVLDVAKEQFQKSADITFTYKRNKKKNPKSGKMQTIGWTFTIKKKTNQQLETIIKSWGLDEAETARIIKKHMNGQDEDENAIVEAQTPSEAVFEDDVMETLPKEIIDLPFQGTLEEKDFIPFE